MNLGKPLSQPREPRGERRRQSTTAQQEVTMELHTEVQSLLKSIGAADADLRRPGCPQPDRRLAHRRRAAGHRLHHRREGRSRRAGIPRRGAACRRPGAASWCAGSASWCARTRSRSGGWSRSRPARSCRKGLGEVQEVIDICDFAVGLSRQLHGLDHRQRAARASHDGDLASARAGGGDQRLQLPGRGVGLERGARAGVRRHGAVETLGEDAAHRARHARAAGACCATQWAMCPRT